MKSDEPLSIIRRRKGAVDDVAIGCDLFRLKRMGTDAWWAAATRDDRTTMFLVRWDRRLKRLVVTVTQDELNCGDDSGTASAEGMQE